MRALLTGTSESFDEGDAAPIAIDESRIGEQIEQATKPANNMIHQQVDADTNDMKPRDQAVEKQDI